MWIEKSVTRVNDRHHEACLVMPNSDPEFSRGSFREHFYEIILKNCALENVHQVLVRSGLVTWVLSQHDPVSNLA